MEHIRHHTLLSVTTSYIGRPYVIINTRDVDDFRDPASDREGERASRRLYAYISTYTPGFKLLAFGTVVIGSVIGFSIYSTGWLCWYSDRRW